MPTEPKAWPTHGTAKDARDWSAERAASIRRHIDEIMDLRSQGKLSELELAYRLAVIGRDASDILRLLEREGAPTRPYER